MAERSPGGRTPDDGKLLGRGSALIADYIAQQQGAADLANFALQAPNAGVTAGGTAILGADTPVQTDLPLDGGADTSVYTPTACALSTNSTTGADPAGVNTSLLLTPTGSASEALLVGPKFSLPGTAWVHIAGGIQHHRVSVDTTASITITWYDDSGVVVNDVTGYSNRVIGPWTFDTTTTDTWLHVDEWAQVPTGATQCALQWAVDPSTGNLSASALTYLNNFRVEAATLYTGVHAGYVRPRAVWGESWGYVDYRESTFNQTGITTEVDVLASTGPTVVFQVFCSVVAGRRYRIKARLVVNGTSGDTIRVKLVDAAGVSGNVIDQAQVTLGATNSVYRLELEEKFDAAASTSSFFRSCRIVRQVGTGGTCAIAPLSTMKCIFYVEDVGPIRSSGTGQTSEPPESYL